MKKCNKCNKLKNTDEFVSRNDGTSKDGKRNLCYECSRIYNNNYLKKDIEKTREKRRQYYNKNKIIINEKRRNWNKINKDKIKKYINKWNINNKDKIILNYNLVNNKLKRRLNNSLKKHLKGVRFSNTISVLIDCSIEQLKLHLQQTAINNGYSDFDINNYSGKEYHIDHIVPCAAFNLECKYHQKLCYNWSNLQILDEKLNISKQNKYDINKL